MSIFNSGRLIGDADIRSANPDEPQSIFFINTGSIQGDVFLHAGDDLFDGRAGTISGALYGGAGNDQLLTGSGAQTINGGAGNDQLSGGTGADTLTGGAGGDFFRYETGFGIDTITDFDAAAGDRIEVRGYSSWTSMIQQGANVIVSFAAGEQLILANVSLANVGAASFVFGAAVIASNNIAAPPTAIGAPGTPTHIDALVNDVRNDFNGDGRSDILWRNASTGQLSDWLGQANGGFVGNDANAFATVPISWSMVGTGDFNGDGRDDVLWRNSNGQLSDWLGTVNGGFTPNDANAFTTVPTSWSVVGTGDFNGDGRDDVLWRNTNGQLSDWLGQANGGFVGNDANAFTSVPTTWHVAGVGDFNGDGRDDILWRNDAGQLSDWLGQANGGFVGNDANAFTTVPTSWTVVAIGDYNGDGRDDILWRNSNGQLSDWLGQANGGFVGNDANASTTVPIAWHVQPEPFLL